MSPKTTNYRRDCDDGYGGVLIGVSTTLGSEPAHFVKCVLLVYILCHSQQLIVFGAHRLPIVEIIYYLPAEFM